MTGKLNFVLLSASALALGACASQSISEANVLTDAQRNECASLRAQHVDLNQTAVLPDYCKDQAGVGWSSEPKDPIKLDLGKDKKVD